MLSAAFHKVRPKSPGQKRNKDAGGVRERRERGEREMVKLVIS